MAALAVWGCLHMESLLRSGPQTERVFYLRLPYMFQRIQLHLQLKTYDYLIVANKSRIVISFLFPPHIMLIVLKK